MLNPRQLKLMEKLNSLSISWSKYFRCDILQLWADVLLGARQITLECSYRIQLIYSPPVLVHFYMCGC